MVFLPRLRGSPGLLVFRTAGCNYRIGYYSAARPVYPLFYVGQHANFDLETRPPARMNSAASHSPTMLKDTLFAILGVACLLPLTTSAQDAKPPSPVRAVFEGNLEYGGDDLVTVFFTNGEDQQMKAGQGGTLAIGGEFAPPALPLLLRATLGLKYNTEAADNANINFVRYPLNLMGYLTFARGFRLGGGVTKHVGARLKGDGFVDDLQFDSSAGARFEFGYRWVALTYTTLTYTADSGEDFSGNSFGVSFSFTLPGAY